MQKFAFRTLAERIDEMPYAGISIMGHNHIGYKFPHDPACNRFAREIHGCEWLQDKRLYMFSARSEEQVEAIIVGLRRLNEFVRIAHEKNEAECAAYLAKAAKAAKAAKP